MTDARLSHDGRTLTVRMPMAFAMRRGRKLVISLKSKGQELCMRTGLGCPGQSAMARFAWLVAHRVGKEWPHHTGRRDGASQVASRPRPPWSGTASGFCVSAGEKIPH